jgi:tRNA pseudouridine38-40 synthase
MAARASSRKRNPCWIALIETEPQRVALTIEYDGSRFNGWQLQRGSEVTTVQHVLEQAASSVADSPLRMHCAGRTDTGVHATNQVVHFDSNNHRNSRAWLMGTNANLPPSVAVRSAQIVKADFHARFSAQWRRYRYLIYNSQVRSALAPQYLTWVRQPLAVDLMQHAAQSLLGERDFSSFRAASCQSSTAMRRVDFVEVSRSGSLVIVDIQANAFLHHMVRNIVGTLVAVGKGRSSPDWVAKLLTLKDRTQAADTAAANGLYLVQVGYPAASGIVTGPLGPILLGPDAR